MIIYNDVKGICTSKVRNTKANSRITIEDFWGLPCNPVGLILANQIIQIGFVIDAVSPYDLSC